MIATMPFYVTGCTSTGGCYHAGIPTGALPCSNCHAYGPNRSRNYAIPSQPKEQKKRTKGQQIRDGLKNLPRNRKGMRF